MIKKHLKYSSDFIIKVNEIFHNAEGISYENNHPEIFSAEADRWIRFSEIIFLKSIQHPVQFLDVGSGTGFVPLNIAGFLNKNDIFICSDISQEKLNICRDNISRKNFMCTFKYVKLNGLNLPFEPSSCDFISMNSVLHHIPDFAPLFIELDRILKTDGMILIGHEPNKLFYQNMYLRFLQSILCTILSPRTFAVTILRKLYLYNRVRRITSGFEKSVKTNIEILNKVNKVLLNEKLIAFPLTSSQLTEIVDIHSPIAGGNLHIDSGIDFLSLIKIYLPKYKLEYFKTYNHLGYIRSKNRLIGKLSEILETKFPNEGELFSAILSKISIK